VRTLVLLLLLSTGSAQADDAPIPPPWGQAKTLGQKMALEDARVCIDAKGRVLAIHRNESLYYGDARTLISVNSDGSSVFDPRQQKGAAYARFYESHDECEVECGTRVVKLPRVPEEKATALLLAAQYAPNPHQREPHALLRDDRGVYYFVDRGRAEGEEKNFRLYVGPKGAMVMQKMTNVVSDSAGDIFSTKSGDLRLLIDREKASEWIQKRKRTPLRYLEPEENLHLIYAELGVYAGQRLGSPCDDL
jgi:hypothetical protein